MAFNFLFDLRWVSFIFPRHTFDSMRLGSLDDLCSLNLGTMSTNVRREEFMVTDHGIDKQGAAETGRKREAIPIPSG